MRLGDILDAEAVKVLGATSSKKRLFQDLGDLAQSAYGLNPVLVVETLLEREVLGPTGVGHGVALPHTRLAEVDRIRGLFIRLEKPIDFDSIDRQPVDLVFALIAPSSAGVEHLKALALVSRTLRDVNLRSKLRANSDPATLHTILTESQASQAA
jgi:nitrogen PTS system EIIA component